MIEVGDISVTPSNMLIVLKFVHSSFHDPRLRLGFVAYDGDTLRCPFYIGTIHEDTIVPKDRYD